MLNRADAFALCFADRREAGRLLASRLANFTGREDVIVLGLSNGGMMVASEIAQQLHLELDTLLVRRIEVPGRPYLHMGAVAEGGPVVMNPDVIQSVAIDPATIEMHTVIAEGELDLQVRRFRRHEPAPNLRGRTVILVDDGVVTGASMRAAIMALRERSVAWIVIAAPVIPALTCDLLKYAAERVVTVAEPDSIDSLDDWYEEFALVSDAAVGELLSRSPAAAALM